MNKTESVKIHLENHGAITSWEAIKEYGATRLSSIIYNLRHQYGLNIENEWVEFTDRFGSKSKYVKYTLNREENKSDD